MEMNTKFESWSPIFSSIVVSSVWGLSAAVRVVWITMLALKDRSGFVPGTVPGLARMAVVSVEECEEALRIFEAPDEYSRNAEYEGRRIKTVDGGWMILGHQRFQEKMKEVSARTGNAIRQARWRERTGHGPKRKKWNPEKSAIQPGWKGTTEELAEILRQEHGPEPDEGEELTPEERIERVKLKIAEAERTEDEAKAKLRRKNEGEIL